MGFEDGSELRFGGGFLEDIGDNNIARTRRAIKRVVNVTALYTMILVSSLDGDT